MKKHVFAILKGVLLMVAASAHGDAVPGRVADLDWMVGYWSGPMGEDTLEEHWMHPSADSVVGSVRITAEGSTRMMEFIVIEQVGDSLELRVQQWQPGMKAMYDEAQVMTLKAQGERHVVFEHPGGFVFRTLGYRRPEPDLFVIEAEFATGESLELELRPR